ESNAYALDSNLCRNLFVDDARFASKPIDDGHRGAFGPLLRHAGALMVRTLAEQTSASYTLIARTELALDALKRARGAWTFADIPRMLGRLDDARLMGVLESLDAGVEHLLLDEYQDTSLEQHAMVAPMLEEIASEASASRSAVCVGDVKQSLYMWREATPEILGTLSDRYPSLDGRSLSKSWRTSSVVLDEVNAVFEDIATNDALVDGMRGGGEDFAEHWETQTAAREVPGFFVFEAVDASEEEAAGDARFERAAMCAREIVDRAPDATVGILTRVKKGVIPRMLEALKAAGVEASEEGGNPLTDSPAVACAVSALRFASRPGGTVWAYHAFASALGPVCGVTDPADTAEVREAGRAIRRMLAERGPAAVFEAWRKGLIGRMTARDASRFAQLVELAERLEREGAPLDPGSLSERIETERVEATSAARVRVMTIHASKGLEFDAVILPDLERAFGISRDSFIVEREGSLGGVRAVTRFPRKEVRDASPELTRMHDGAMRRHVLGELCGLYVGMTRARRWLHMIVDAPKEPGAYRASLAGVARAALAPGLGDAGVLHAEGDPSCLDGLAGDAPGPVDGVPAVRLRLRTGGGLGGGLGAGALARRSPSTIGRDEGSVAASRLLSLDRDAADIGTLIHDACELIGWTDEPGWAFDVASFARSVAERRGVAEGVARGAVERVARALGAPGVHEALARSRYNSPCELWRERAFAARVERDGSPVLLRGRFDRVVVGRDEGGGVSWCEVLDFKSEAQPAGDVGEAAGAYRTQMEAYRDALVAMTGVRTEDVRLTLVFIDRREVVTLDQSAAGGVEGS
ncbi:MAG: PD-(D/E)XK nuclease family protein, partial [Planctomycetota bacterium]